MMSMTPLSSATTQPPQVPPALIPLPSEARKIYRENPISAIPGDWSVRNCRSAMAMHIQGMFTNSSLLVDAMTGDDCISDALSKIIGGCLRLPFKMAKARGSRKAKRARDFVRSWWDNAIGTDSLYDLCKWVIMMGFGLAEIVWDTTSDPRKWRPISLKVWHPQFVYWREDIRRFIVQTADGPMEVEPGNGKWVLLMPTGQRGWMNGLVRQLWRWWITRDFAWRDWSHFSEVMGHPIVKATVPAEAEAADKMKFKTDAQNMGADGIALLEQSQGGREGGWKYDLDLLEAKTDHSKGFNLLIQRCESNTKICILGQDATSQNDGAYVARGVFAKVTLDKIDSLIGTLSGGLRAQICRPACAFNYDDASLSPEPRWDSEPPPDKANYAASLMNVGQFLETSAQAGYQPDLKTLSKRIGLKIKKANTAPIAVQKQKLETAPAKAPKLPVSNSPASRLAIAAMSGDTNAIDLALDEYEQWRQAA